MQVLPTSNKHSQKIPSTAMLNSSIIDAPIITSQLLVNESPLQPLKTEKNFYKSRIRTGLTPRIDRRGVSSDFQTAEFEGTSPRTSIPCKDYKSLTGFLNAGIQIKKIGTGVRNENAEKLKKILQRHKEKNAKTLQSTRDVSEIAGVHITFRDSFLIIQKSKFSMFGIRSRHKRQCRSSLRRVDPQPVKSSLKEMPKIRRKNMQKIEKASIKDAIRDKDWLSKAKPQIIKSFFTHINKSNGIKADLPTDSFFYYRYYLGKGNNSNLIKQCLSSRWWWTRVSVDEISTANFVWTQWKDKKVIESLDKLRVQHEIDSNLAVSVTTNVRYHSPQGHSRPKLVDISSLGFNLITRSKNFTALKTGKIESAETRLYNKIEHNFHLSNKKALFFNLQSYYKALGEDVFSVIPVTFHLNSSEDPAFKEFEQCFKSFEELTDEQGRKPANIWIVKPGENSNRGNGINVCNGLEQIKNELKVNPHPQTGKHTYIVQKYIERPFLVNKRKFDIRCYSLVTCINSCVQGYVYSEGYLRTASKPFSLQNTNKFIHLTNDAVQKYADDYGKFESGNKMSYIEFQRYLDVHCLEKTVNFVEEVVPEIKQIIKRTIESVFSKLDPNKRAHTFEIFGYDFLLDSDLKPWLLEVNTNPCLELSSPHLARVIPNMIDNALRIALDPIFQEPPSHIKHINSPNPCDIPENKFELVFHSAADGESVAEKFADIKEMDQKEIEELSNETDDFPDSGSEDL